MSKILLLNFYKVKNRRGDTKSGIKRRNKTLVVTNNQIFSTIFPSSIHYYAITELKINYSTTISNS